MNKRQRWTLGLVLLLVGAVTFGLSAMPGQGGRGPQGEGVQEPPRIDFAAAAQTLGIEESALLEALGLPAEGPGERPEREERSERERPDLAAAAEALGVTEDALMEALGDPEAGRPDFAAAAEILGVTEEALVEALGVPQGGEGGAASAGRATGASAARHRRSS